MALTGDERRLISTANMHLPGRQHDPRGARDLWRLAQWERARMRAQRAGAERVDSPSELDSGARLGAPPVPRRKPLPGGDRHELRPQAPQPRADRRARARAARAYLKGIGYDDEALAKPLIAVANTWIETMPCNFHLRALAAKVKEGIRAAGGTPMELNTIAISDGITMGTPGMRASLVSRELIADSIELVVDAHVFDAVIAISGCDKTIPATVMALCRLDLPSVMLYGGSILPGNLHGERVTIQEVFEAVGAHAAGRITDAELTEIEDAASPGAGACGGQFTANTMAMAFEVLGISPAGFSMVPAVDPRKAEVAAAAGELVMDVLRRGLRPSRDHHPAGAGERDRRDRLQRRLDQRRAAPAGHRPGDGGRARRSTTSTRSASARRCSATSSPAAGSSRPTCTRRAACRW